MGRGNYLSLPSYLQKPRPDATAGAGFLDMYGGGFATVPVLQSHVVSLTLRVGASRATQEPPTKYRQAGWTGLLLSYSLTAAGFHLGVGLCH